MSNEKEIKKLKKEIEAVLQKLCDWIHKITNNKIGSRFTIHTSRNHLEYNITSELGVFLNTETPVPSPGIFYNDDFELCLKECDKEAILKKIKEIRKNLFNELFCEMINKLFVNSIELAKCTCNSEILIGLKRDI